MKVGIDIHGTITDDPEYFAAIAAFFRQAGVEIHITTGIRTETAISKLEEFEIAYDYVFSITDYHESIGTPIEWDEVGNPHIEDEVWNRSKADYCKRENIDFHIDNTEIYGIYFEGIKTVFMLYHSGDEIPILEMVGETPVIEIIMVGETPVIEILPEENLFEDL